jgi:hypothetical protein
MGGTGPYAALLQQRFALAVKRFGLDQPRPALDLTRFHRNGRQMSLF